MSEQSEQVEQDAVSATDESRPKSEGVEEKLRRRTHDLEERVKELSCLYDVSTMIDGYDLEDRDAVLQSVAERLPDGWQFPELAEAHLEVCGECYETARFAEARSELSAELTDGHNAGRASRVGSVTVGYRMTDGETPPFIPEEQDLIDELANRISQTVRRWDDEAEIRRQARELNASKLRCEALVEASSDVISVVDRDGTILYVSAAHKALFGCEPRDQIGTSLFENEHFDAIGQEKLRSLFEEALVRDGEPPMHEFDARHHDGSLRRISLTLRNHLETPAIEGVVVTWRDITQAVTLREQLLRAQKMEAIGRLAGGIAHDFNNLLTVVASYSQFLLSDFPEEDPRRGDALEIFNAAQRASELTRDLLAISKRQTLHPISIDLNDLLRDLKRMLSRVLTDNIEFETDFAPALPEVEIDITRIEHVLLNLVVNASDAMPNGGKLTIQTACVRDGDKPRVTVEVCDTGEGIPLEDREQIFEPFYTTKEHGTGLGLSTIRGIIEQSGGDIEVESELGGGTTFRISFPAGSSTGLEERSTEAHLANLPN